MELFRHGMSRFFPVSSDDGGVKLLFLLLSTGAVVGVLRRSAMAATQVCFICGGSGSFLVGGVRLWLLREGAGGGVAIDSGEDPVSFVYSFRFAVGWECLFSRSTSSVKTMADRVTGRLSSMSSTRAAAVSFFPCHQWCGSADVRSAVLVDRQHGLAILAPAAVSKVWSCVQR